MKKLIIKNQTPTNNPWGTAAKQAALKSGIKYNYNSKEQVVSKGKNRMTSYSGNGLFDKRRKSTTSATENAYENQKALEAYNHRDDNREGYVYNSRAYLNDDGNLSYTNSTEGHTQHKPLESVHPEFDALMGGSLGGLKGALSGLGGYYGANVGEHYGGTPGALAGGLIGAGTTLYGLDYATKFGKGVYNAGKFAYNVGTHPMTKFTFNNLINNSDFRSDFGKSIYNIATDPELRQSIKTAYHIPSETNFKNQLSDIVKASGKELDNGLYYGTTKGGLRWSWGNGDLHTGQAVAMGRTSDGTIGLNLGGGANLPHAVRELKAAMSETPKGSSFSGDAHAPSVAAHLRGRFDRGEYDDIIHEIANKNYNSNIYPEFHGMFDGMSPDAMSMFARMAKGNPDLYHIEYGIKPAGQFNPLAKPDGRNYHIYTAQKDYLNGNISAEQYQGILDPWLKDLGLKPSYLDESGKVSVHQPFLVRHLNGGLII